MTVKYEHIFLQYEIVTQLFYYIVIPLQTNLASEAKKYSTSFSCPRGEIMASCSGDCRDEVRYPPPR